MPETTPPTSDASDATAAPLEPAVAAADPVQPETDLWTLSTEGPPEAAETDATGATAATAAPRSPATRAMEHVSAGTVAVGLIAAIAIGSLGFAVGRATAPPTTADGSQVSAPSRGLTGDGRGSWRMGGAQGAPDTDGQGVGPGGHGRMRGDRNGDASGGASGDVPGGNGWSHP